jgi:hypothetical protein
MGKKVRPSNDNLPRGMFFIGIVLIIISLYPIYKNSTLPDKSELLKTSGKVIDLIRKRGIRGADRIEIAFLNNDKKFILDDIILKNISNYKLNQIKNNVILELGIDTNCSVINELSITSDNIYSIKINEKEIISFNEIIDIRFRNNLKYFLFFLISGLLTIGLALLYIYKINNKTHIT